jgi:hypothetical protein
MFTLLLTSFPKLARLFYLCKHSPLLCFSLVLFFLFLGVIFEFSLIPFWGCLNLSWCAFICFIGSLEPSQTVKQAFHLPFDQIAQDPTNKLAWCFFLLLPHCCLHFIQRGRSSHREVFACLKRFMVVIGLLFQKSLHMPHVCPNLTTHGKIL